MAKRVKKEEQLLNQVVDKAYGDIARDAYLEYGNYVNNHRHICRVHDGTKLSYRRLIWAALQYPKGKDIASTTLISSVATWHPHGLTGIEDLNANLTLSGVFSGEGSFGSIDIDGTKNPHASPRYTKNRLSDLYWEIIGDLIKDVAKIESPVGALEPEYIPLPIPLCLFMKNQVSGLGVGVRTEYPSFSARSLYQAYINNNPELLEPSVDLFIDKSNSELKRIWETGKGKVIYSYKISRKISDDGKSEGILFEGDTGLFTPDLKKFKKLEAEGKVYIENMTDYLGPKLFIGRVPGARNITIEEIETLARKSCYSNTTYSLNVSNGKTTFRISLYNWLEFVYKNYISLVTESNRRKIEKTKFDILIQEALPEVGNYILNINSKATDEEISLKLNRPIEIVKEVMSKPISYLRNNKDTSHRIKTLKEKLKILKKFNPIQFTEEIINML